MNTAGIIFAGGKARRLGGLDKAELKIGSLSCLNRVRHVLGGLDDVVISGRDIPDWKTPDAEREGVVFGLLGALDWAHVRGLDFIVTSSVDTPFLPADYVDHLLASLASRAPVVSVSESGFHGLHALWPISVYRQVKDLILEQGERRISNLHKALASQDCKFTARGYDPFFNINTPDDLAQARKIAKGL